MIRIEFSGVPTEDLSRSKEVEAALNGFTREGYVILDNIVPQDTICSLHEEFLMPYRDQIRDRAPRIAGNLGVDPLSDATVENGCMFLLPAGVSCEISDAIDTDTALSPRVVRSALQDVIALPATAGAMIGWRGNILHWGGANAGGAEPRLSLALELRSRGVRPSKFERPLIAPRAPLTSFRLRLFAITKALREYTKF